MDKLAILCVDDEEIILQSLKNELYSFSEKYLIELAADGDEALEALEELQLEGYELALVISDYVMPRMKGDELLCQIHLNYPNALKIMLTGQSNVEGISNAINHASLYRYIAKPWEKEDLVLTIQEALTKYIQSRKLEQQNLLLEEQNVQLRELNNELEVKVQERTAEILQQSNKILNQKEALASAYDELKKLGEFKEVITGTIVHDLKNPLNSIISLSDDPSIKQSGRQMLNLVMSILDVQKFEEPTFQVVTSEFPIQRIIDSAYEQVDFMAKNKNHEIINQIPPDIRVYVDLNIIIRVFVNLLTNAIKYTPNNGTITLGCKELASEGKNQITLYVTDTGEGIPEDQIETIFDRFAQVDAKKLGVVGSTGIGLTFCKMAILAHGGDIWAESNLHEGATFYFTIPSKFIESEMTSFVQVLATNQETPLTEEERVIIRPLIEQFKKLEIYDTSAIQNVLDKVDFAQSEGLKQWQSQMLDALFSVNEEKYKELLNQVN